MIVLRPYQHRGSDISRLSLCFLRERGRPEEITTREPHPINRDRSCIPDCFNDKITSKASAIQERRYGAAVSRYTAMIPSIQLRIKNESDLYNPFDPAKTTINDGVYHYLKTFCTEAEAKRHLHDTLQIISDGPLDAERAKAAIQNAVKKDQDEYERQFAENRKRAAWLYLVGIILSVAGIALALLLDQIVLQLISFFGSMAIRDAVTIQLKQNPDIRRMKLLPEPFRDFTLEVVLSEETARG